MTKSRNTLDGKIIHIRRGLAIYKVAASPYYRVRLWIPSTGKRIVRTTKCSSRVEAISAAEEFMNSLGTRGILDETPETKTFAYFANKIIAQEQAKGQRNELSARNWKTTKFYLNHDVWGLLKRFSKTDVRQIRTPDYHQYMDWVQEQDKTLAPATLNYIASTFSKVLKLAHKEGIIESLPATPRFKRKDNPRAFFWFHPLVSKEYDEYKLLLRTAKEMAEEQVRVRDTVITTELYDFILFMTHSFLRPTESEIYGLTHKDITVANDPRRLIINVKQGKTGHRIANTMPYAVNVYERICDRQENRARDDYIFLPEYKNRSTAKQIIQRQFNAVLARMNLKNDPHTNSVHTVYSLRHQAICMRLILSEGKVNIYNLAKNAGTSVSQIERFYSKNLPLSREMAKNLQVFGAPDITK